MSAAPGTIGHQRVELPLPGGGSLRPLTAADVTQAYVDGLNDPEVHRYLTAPRAARQTLDNVRAYVAANREAADSILFGIFLAGILRGTVRLHDIDTARGFAHIGIALFDKSVWGQGWGSKAIAAVRDYATGTLGLHMLDAGIEPGNAGSLRAFAKAGFRDTGRNAGAADPHLLRFEVATTRLAPGEQSA